MGTNEIHLNRKLETRNCYVGGNSEHSDIDCARNTVASTKHCRTMFIAGRRGTVATGLATAAYLKQPVTIDKWRRPVFIT
jgi:hypothetical protein